MGVLSPETWQFWYDRLSMSAVRAFHALLSLLLSAVVACGGAAPSEAPPPVETPPDTSDASVEDDGAARIAGTALPARGMVRSIIALEPHAELDEPVSEEVPVIDQYGRLFIPDFLMVQAGQTVRFTNSEDDLHTVHVKDEAGESLINVATINGSRYDFLVEKPGEYVVICNTHTEMFADILAFDTPYFVMAEADGSFSLDGVVPGTYTVVVFYGGERTEREVELVAGPNQLDLTG
jgi:plastocyanin